jgi:hypothetical protein
MPPRLVSPAVVRALLLGTCVAVPVFAVPVVVVPGAGTQLGLLVEVGVVVVVPRVVGLCGVAGATVPPCCGAGMVAVGAGIVPVGAEPGFCVVVPVVCAAASVPPTSSMEMNADVRLILSLSLY